MTEKPTGARRARPSDDELMDAVPQGAGGREVRVGIFVIVGLISFIVVLFMLTDPSTFRGRYKIVTVLESAGGIRRGDPIQMRGVNIGRIAKFELSRGGGVAITMEIEGEWPVPEGSRTVLGATGLFGGRTMDVIQGNGPGFVGSWDTIPGSDAGGDVMGAMEDLSGQAGTVFERIEALLSDSTVGTMQGSASELETLLTELSGVVSEQRGTLSELTQSLARSAEGLETAAGAGPDVARAAARADSAMMALAATGENLDNAIVSLQSVLARMDAGEGTLGKLSKDDSLYVNLNAAAESILALVEDLQANPSKYINISIF
jgi:phospholipid/cholesterol/gamma-HCH transport system substrate-binding protein